MDTPNSPRHRDENAHSCQLPLRPRWAVPITVVLLLIAALTVFADQQKPAFPSATGFGRHADGWRGGVVVRVSNLADIGPGSLRACAEDRNRPRVCIFDISGTIEVSRPIRVASNTYIAGQTAPAQGIQVKLGTSQSTPIVVKNARDVLLRFLKLRPGDSSNPSANVDGITIESSRDIYLQHLSVQFATDESINVHTNTLPTQDITIERCIVALSLDKANHPKGRHSKGALICSHEGPGAAPCGRISLIENLFAHHRDRNPDLKATAIGPIEVINNVFYNPISQFGEFYNLHGDTRINYIGNVALAGPSTRSVRRPAAVEAFDWNDEFVLEIFAVDNLNLDRQRCKGSQALSVIDDQAKAFLVAEPILPIAHRPLAAADTLDHVLTAAGARLPDAAFFDRLDAAVIAEVRNCRGKVIDSPDEVGGWPNLIVERGASDIDQDGMPDTWESKHAGLDPSDPSDVWEDRDGDGWTNLEEYLSTIAGDFATEVRRPY